MMKNSSSWHQFSSPNYSYPLLYPTFCVFKMEWRYLWHGFILRIQWNNTLQGLSTVLRERNCSINVNCDSKNITGLDFSHTFCVVAFGGEKEEENRFTRRQKQVHRQLAGNSEKEELRGFVPFFEVFCHQESPVGCDKLPNKGSEGEEYSIGFLSLSLLQAHLPEAEEKGTCSLPSPNSLGSQFWKHFPLSGQWHSMPFINRNCCLLSFRQWQSQNKSMTVV